MSVPSNTKTTAVAVGNREDLADTIKRIYADEMPLQNMAGSGKAKAVDHDWLTADIRAGALGNAQPEGADATITSAQPRRRLRNKCQIFTEGLSVSGTQEAVNKAGIRSEYKEQKKLKMLSLGLDKEVTYCSGQAAADQTGTSAGQGRKMSGIQCFVTFADHSSRGAGGADGAIDANGYATAPTGGTNRVFGEAQLKAVLLGMYQNGAGGNKTALMGAALKDTFAGFGGTVPNRHNVGDGDVSIVASVDYYKSNYGVIKARAHQSALPNECLVVQEDVIEICKLRPTRSGKLARTGDTMKADIVGEETLKIKNDKGLGIIADVTAS